MVYMDTANLSDGIITPGRQGPYLLVFAFLASSLSKFCVNICDVDELIKIIILWKDPEGTKRSRYQEKCLHTLST